MLKLHSSLKGTGVHVTINHLDAIFKKAVWWK